MLVQQLLAFGRRQMIQLERLDLNEVISSFLSILHRVIGEHIRVEFLPGPLPGSIIADRGQLEQIILNLSINARDAMPEGGVVRVETVRVSFDAFFCSAHPWAKPGAFVRLTVSDTGLGMDAATLARIWEPFFTTKPAGKGTGLGLATVYGIVQQREGIIRAVSEPGGARPLTFISLGRSGRRYASNRSRRRACSAAVKRFFSRRMRRWCEIPRAGCWRRRVMWFWPRENGEHALALAKEYDGKIDLALLDVVMPVLGGRAAYEQLKSQYPEMRFLFASGYNVDMVDPSFVLEEGLEIVKKPFNGSLLLRKIREVLD